MKRSLNRGVALISVMALMVIILMLVGVLLKRGESGLYRVSYYRDGIRASQASKGGVNHLMALLEADNTYSGTELIQLDDSEYGFSFDTSTEYYCVNNLNGSAPSTQLTVAGIEVPPYSADLYIVGASSKTKRVAHVLVQQGFSSARSVAAVGRVELAGDVLVDGVKSLRPMPGETALQPAPGGIFSKYKATSHLDSAISWSAGSGTFALSELSRLEAAPAVTDGRAISADLETLFPDRTVNNGAADSIPDIDVDAVVIDGLASPALAPGGATLTGQVYVSSPRSVSGNLTVNGDLFLTEGTLYVQDNLTINGSVQGTGAIYVAGDINVIGGNAVVSTELPRGTAILAGGDVNLQGVDAAGYLRTMAQANGFEPAVDRMELLLNDYSTDDGSSGYSAISEKLGKDDVNGVGPEGRSVEAWVSPVPGPDGTHALAQSNAATTRLILDIQENYPSWATDPQAQKVVRGLEQLQQHFRENQNTVRYNGDAYTNFDGTQFFTRTDDGRLWPATGGAVPTSGFDSSETGDDLMVGTDFDDQDEATETRTHDSLSSDSAGGDMHEVRRDAFMAQNEFGLGWLGESSFQGLVYARGNITANTKFKILGSLVSLGNVNLGDDSELIFNEDYRDVVGARLPLGLVHYEEL